MKRPSITCRCCNGKGIEPLPQGLWDTLRLLKKRGPSTAGNLLPTLRSDGIQASAVNNRLEALRKLDYVERKKRSREWVYYVKRSEKEVHA